MNSKEKVLPAFLTGGGEMGEQIRSFDWSKTSLGSPDTWPQSLRIAVRILLDCPFGMYIAWGSEYIQMYNDGYRPILGSTKHPQALGISTRQTFAEIWTTIGPMFEGVMQGIPIGFPDFILHMDRNGFLEECVFDFSYSPIRLEDGEVGGVLVTVIETTEKVNNFKKLTESNNQLNFAIEATELSSWDYNPLTNQFTGNTRLKDWFGLQHEVQIDLSRAIDVIIEKDRNRVADAIQNALQYQSGGLYDIEYSILNPLTKQERIVRAKGRAWFGDDKTANRFNGTLQDITEQTIARIKIEEREQKFRLLADSMPQFIWTADANGILNYFNQSVYNFSSLNEEELIKEGGWLEIVHPDEREENIKLWFDSVRNGTDFKFEHRFRRYDGEFRWQLSRAKPQLDENGNIQMWVGTSTDIQDQKDFAESLETEVRERTEQLQLITLLRQQKKLQNSEAINGILQQVH
ncbi:MAG: PAS domain-containing protein [Bacteroidota bacterium]|nr:PAS domain-containing protein [Bacteroidota bacterium]